MGIRSVALAVALLGGVIGCDNNGCPGCETVPEPVSGMGGVWRVEAAGEPEGTVLNMSGGDLAIHEPCVSFWGYWIAREGMFFGSLDPEMQPLVHRGCTDTWPPTPTWIDTARSYERTSDGWTLRDGTGTTVAILRRGGKIPANTTGGFSDFYGGDEPQPNIGERATLNSVDAAPLPVGAVPATAAALLGRWEPQTIPERCDLPFIEFRSDGTWRGQDAETKLRGRWLLGAEGLAFGDAKAHVLGPCSGASSPDGWMFRLARMGFEGDVLALYDTAGQPLARLTRA